MKLSNTRIKVYSFFEGPTVSTRIFGFATVPENKYGEAILECNSLNDEYKFAKFYIDKDNEVVISMDAYLDENSAGEEAYKTAMVLIEIAEDAYPKLQKAIWA